MTTKNIDIKTQKKELRKVVKNLIAKISDEKKNIKSAKIFEKIESIDKFENANTVLMFWSMKDEVQTQKFVEKYSKNKRIILPIVKGNNLVFSKFTGTENMSVNVFGILEPSQTDTVKSGEIDFAIIPGLAFSEAGSRLGRGKGFYDKVLDEINCMKVGICFREQIFEEIPAESFDKKVDFVIFE